MTLPRKKQPEEQPKRKLLAALRRTVRAQDALASEYRAFGWNLSGDRAESEAADLRRTVARLKPL